MSLSTSQQSFIPHHEWGLLEFAPIHSCHRSAGVAAEEHYSHREHSSQEECGWGGVPPEKLLPLLYLCILMAPLSLPGTWLSQHLTIFMKSHSQCVISLFPALPQRLKSVGSKLCIVYQVWAVSFQRAPILWKTGGCVQPLKNCA